MKYIYLLTLHLLINLPLFAQQDHFLWVRTQGSSSFELGKSVAVDKLGNVYSTGTFENVVDFDPSPAEFSLTSRGYSDIYLLKLDSKGNFIWAKQLGGIRIDHVNSLSIDSLNNLLITGSYENSINVDPNSGSYNLISNGSNEGFVASYNSLGQLQWAFSLGGPGYDNATSAVSTQDGHILITGDFQDSMDVLTGPSTSYLYSHGNSDVYFIELNSNGSLVWAKSIGGKFADYGTKINSDIDGNILIAGQFRDTVDFDPSLLGIHFVINPPPPFSIPATVDYNTFILKLDPNGAFNWAVQYNALTSSNEVRGIISDDQRNIYTSGTFSGNTDFDPGPNIDTLSVIGFSGYIAKLDENGNFIWAKRFKGSGDCAVLSLAHDSSFNLYTTGQFSHSFDFDPNLGSFILSSVGFNTNPFISKLDKDGNFVWAKHLSGGGSGGAGIFIDKHSTVYTCGGWSDTLNFHPDSTFTLQSQGLFDAFVHKISQCPGTFYADKYVSACDSFVSNNHTYTESGIYSDTIINELLCDSIFNLHLTINKVDIQFTNKNVSCQEINDGSIHITGNAITFSIPEIQSNNFSGLFDNLYPGHYHVISKDSNGCSLSKEIDILQLSCCDKVFLPNAFTPNNDGLNDEFRFLNAYGIELHKFQVFNRWGEPVFSSQNIEDSWDGYYKGGELESGTYYYFIQYNCLSSGKEYIIKGDIDLIR